MIEIVAAHGYEAVTVRGLAKRARISSGTFYKHYSSTEDCLLCAYDLICGRASRRMMEAAQNETEPRRRLALAIERLFEDIVAVPLAATFMLRAAPTVGPAFTDELWSSAMQLGPALQFCISSDDEPPLHPLLLEGIVAGLARIGSHLSPAAGEDEVKEATAEAVDWIMGLCASPLADVELALNTAPHAHRNGLPGSAISRNGDWEGVLGDERAMILAATFRIARSGYHQLSVPRICREAGVSQRTFNRHFETLEDCSVAAIEERAFRAIEGWVQRRTTSVSSASTVYDALSVLCNAIEDDQTWARLLFVDVTAVGTKGVDSRDRLISQAAHVLRTMAPEGQSQSEIATEAAAAAAWAIVVRHVQGQYFAAVEALPILTLLLGNSRQS